jgi:hypothetical protein
MDVICFPKQLLCCELENGSHSKDGQISGTKTTLIKISTQLFHMESDVWEDLSFAKVPVNSSVYKLRPISFLKWPSYAYNLDHSDVSAYTQPMEFSNTTA